MTGMEHAIEHAADVIRRSVIQQVLGEMVEVVADDDGEFERRIACALASAGILAPAPLREEWATRFPNGHLRPGKDMPYDPWWEGDPPKGVNVRRYATDWLPVGLAEGDGRAE